MGHFHPLRLTRTVRDPIHGNIGLTEEEVSIFNHRLFRRLHRVRQNGLLFLVFPSASHTRFEHSLGVLFVADAILQALFSNSLTAWNKTPKAVAALEGALNGQAVDISSTADHVTEGVFRYARLAALVHDLGHGPFSHHFDPFAPRVDEVVRICEQEASLAYLLPEIPRKAERIEHEFISCVLFTEIARQLCLPLEDAQVVSAIILGIPRLCPVMDLRQYIPLLHDIIASAPADADRMDYLERDSRSLGVSYGLYDRNRLLKSFLAYRDERGLRLGIKKSGARAVENFLQARFELFVQIYFHKTNRAVQLMLGRVAERAAKLSQPIFQWSSLEEMATVYEELSDERFLRILRGKDVQWPLADDVFNQTAESIHHRQLWKRVYEGSHVEEANEVAALLHAGGYDCISDTVDPKATKDLAEGARLLIRNGEGIYSHTPKTWMEESVIIAALAEAGGKLVRVYVTTHDHKQAQAARELLWSKGFGRA